MRITVLALGSRGDVQPLIALGLGLKNSGCQVRIATHTYFERAVDNKGLEFFPVQIDPRETLERRTGRLAMARGDNPLLSLVHFVRTIRPLLLKAGHECWAACQGTDAILYSPLGFYLAPHIAERLGVTAIGAFELPLHRTHAFPGYTSPAQHGLGSAFNWCTHVVDQVILMAPCCSPVNRFRRGQLDLAPVRRWMNYAAQWQQRTPVVYGFSPIVVPKPADWGSQIEITGYWFLDRSADWEPPPALASFLAEEPPPVYVGFGSMSGCDAERTTSIVLQALERTEQRGLLAAGWGGLDRTDLSDNVFLVESVPHDWVFPQVAAVVHHGGAGTTAAGLRAGVPSVIVPFFLDQPFWGQRIRDLGVGPPPIPYRALSVDRLADAIRIAVSDREMRARAVELRRLIRAEDGVARAVEAIRRVVAGGRTRWA